MGKLTGLGIIFLGCCIWLAGCSASTIGDEQTTNIHVEKGQADQLDIDLTIDYGQVNISAGADAWVEGDIKYNVNELEPKVAYKLKRDQGNITINQPKRTKVNVKKGTLKNDWNLQL